MKKNKLLTIAIMWVLACVFSNCSDWTDTEANGYFEKQPDTYYEALRAYKKTDHQIAFGWFGNWTGTGSSLVNCMRGIPDSIDFVSVWGNWSNLTPEKKEDLKFCQEVKGTKFLLCFIIANIGDQITPAEVTADIPSDDKEAQKAATKAYWGWEDGNDEAIEAAIRKFANAICDTIDKYNYNGFDIDFEPNYGNAGNLASYSSRMLIFANELSKRVGPKSGTGRLLVVDGEPQTMPAESGEYFDYFIVQAYKPGGDYNLDGRLATTIKNYDGFLTAEEVTNKYVVTENFESVGDAQKGGYPYTDRYGNSMMSLEGMARWQPTNGFKKAGCGAYHMEAEYPTTPEYKWMRNAIQVMNPSVHKMHK